MHQKCWWAFSGGSRGTLDESHVPTKERMESHPGGLAWGHSYIKARALGRQGPALCTLTLLSPESFSQRKTLPCTDLGGFGNGHLAGGNHKTTVKSHTPQHKPYFSAGMEEP